MRRLTRTIVLRDDDGQDWAKHTWDGIANEIVGDAKKIGDIKHYMFLDENGKIIARGNVDAFLVPGPYKIRINNLIDGVGGTAKMAISSHIPEQKGQVIMTFNGTPIKGVARGGQVVVGSWIP